MAAARTLPTPALFRAIISVPPLQRNGLLEQLRRSGLMEQYDLEIQLEEGERMPPRLTFCLDEESGTPERARELYDKMTLALQGVR